MIVESAQGHEFLVSALFHDPASLHHQDAVGSPDRGKAMSDNDARAVGHDRLDGPFDEHFRFRVHAGRCLVQYENPGVSSKDPGKGQELLLACRKVHPAFAYPGVRTLWQLVDHGGKLRQGKDVLQFLAGQPTVEKDILLECTGNDQNVLHDEPDLFTQAVKVQLPEVDTVQEYPAFPGIVEAFEQADDGGLP